jgi:membrane protein YdbS with pleckstrin-like domain
MRVVVAETLLERALLLPAEPSAPAGALESVTIFRAARGFYFYRILQWAIVQLGALVGIVVGALLLAYLPPFPYRWVVEVVEVLAVIVLLVIAPLRFFLLKLDYEMRWYIVTDRSLRIREGILSVDEKTISFANIQNIGIRQGPVQRFLGIADVEVQTAGGGAAVPGETAGKSMHLGYFHGVDNAEEIRDAILRRVRELQDSGLGDPDAHRSDDSDVLAAAHELLEAARSLRARRQSS